MLCRQRTSSPDPFGCSLAADVYLGAGTGVFLLACSPAIGAVLLPLLTAAYGFFPAYAVSCMAASFGRQGVLMAAGFFGLRCLLTFPCFFLLAAAILGSGRCALSSILWERIPGAGGQPQMLAAAFRCVILTLCLGIWLDLRLSPVLAAGAAGTDILGYFRRWRL